jgi:hypothetical protein
MIWYGLVGDAFAAKPAHTMLENAPAIAHKGIQ